MATFTPQETAWIKKQQASGATQDEIASRLNAARSYANKNGMIPQSTLFSTAAKAAAPAMGQLPQPQQEEIQGVVEAQKQIVAGKAMQEFTPEQQSLINERLQSKGLSIQDIPEDQRQQTLINLAKPKGLAEKLPSVGDVARALPKTGAQKAFEQAKAEGKGTVGAALASGVGMASDIGKGTVGAVTGIPQATAGVLDITTRGVELLQPLGKDTGPIDLITNLIQGKGLPERGMITKGTESLYNAASSLTDYFQEKLGLDPNDAAVQAGEFLSPTLGEVSGVAKLSKLGKGLKLEEKIAKSAEKNVEKILAPTKEINKVKTAKVLPELAKNIPISVSRQSLLNKVKVTVEDVGNKIDEFIASGKLKGGVEKNQLIDMFESKKADFMVGGKVVEQAPIKILDSLQNTLRQFPKILSPEDTIQLRRVWDKVVDKSKGFQKTLAEGTEVEFKKEAANLIRNELGKTNPELAALNKQYTLWKNTADVLKETVSRKVGQTGAVTTIGKKAIGAVIGAGSGPFGAVLGAEIVNQLGNIFASTAWRTISANLKTKLAKALAEGDKVKIKGIIKTILNSPEYKRAGVIIPKLTQETND